MKAISASLLHCAEAGNPEERRAGQEEEEVALGRNERLGTRLPELQVKEEMLRHQKAVSTMTFFRADWVLIW